MMNDLVRIFKTDEGDVFHITLSEHTGILSANAIELLRDITLVDIELRRLSGQNTAGLGVLAAIEDTIAELFLKHDDIIISYYCDFINPIPLTSKNSMPPQEYRSRMFGRMFQRYTKQKGITDVRLSVVEINGVNEKYYFHVIYREAHSLLAALIGHDFKDTFDK